MTQRPRKKERESGRKKERKMRNVQHPLRSVSRSQVDRSFATRSVPRRADLSPRARSRERRVYVLRREVAQCFQSRRQLRACAACSHGARVVRALWETISRADHQFPVDRQTSKSTRDCERHDESLSAKDEKREENRGTKAPSRGVWRRGVGGGDRRSPLRVRTRHSVG